MLQSYTNQNSMVLAQNQTHTSMEQNRELRNKPTHSSSINLRQRSARIYNGEDKVSSISGAGKTGQLHVKE